MRACRADNESVRKTAFLGFSLELFKWSPISFADVSTRDNSSWACSKVFDSRAISSAKLVSQITLTGCRLLRDLSRVNSMLLLIPAACLMA